MNYKIYSPNILYNSCGGFQIRRMFIFYIAACFSGLQIR